MSYKLTLKPTGHQIETDADTTLLQATLNAELVVPYGCRDGACGKCKAHVLEGEVDHGRSPESTLPVAEREAGMALMCCAKARSDVVVECREVRDGTEIPVRKLPSRIISLDKAAADVMVMRLQLPAGDAFQFKAGQYIDFLLAAGQRRSFSMANAPQQSNVLELHIRLVPGGNFTDQVFNRLKPRDILRLEGPLGSFALNEAEGASAKPIIFLAGGTGFAPIKSIVEDMIARNIRRPATLYWGARDPAGLYMHELAKKWAAELDWFQYVPVISDNPLEGWQGRRGLVHHAVMEDFPDLASHEVYACGAPAMVDAARLDFATKCGLAEDAFFADAFTFSSSVNPT